MNMAPPRGLAVLFLAAVAASFLVPSVEASGVTENLSSFMMLGGYYAFVMIMYYFYLICVKGGGDTSAAGF